MKARIYLIKLAEGKFGWIIYLGKSTQITKYKFFYRSMIAARYGAIIVANQLGLDILKIDNVKNLKKELEK